MQHFFSNINDLTLCSLISMFETILYTKKSKTTLLIRLMVGAVFLSEGLQKLILSDLRGAGRFEEIGLPFPEFLGSFVGAFEILCGFLILLGALTRLACIPLLLIIISAIASTKIVILTDKGIWNFLHEIRTDWAMLLGLLYLFIKGAGYWSVDIKLAKKKRHIDSRLS